MLKDLLRQGEFIITCEFVPGRGKDGPAVNAAGQFAKDLKSSGARIHAVSLTDNPGGGPAILPDVIAREIEEQGVSALVHFSCRDLNRNAIESRATALARLGINNLLVVTGDYCAEAYEGQGAKVFDLDSVQALRYLKAMNQGLVVPGRKKGTTETLPATNFCLGAGVSPFKLTREELLGQFFKLEKKIAAGADFIISQLGYDMRKFLEIKRYLSSRGLSVPLIGNVYVLSLAVARNMHAGAVPGCVVTEELIKVLTAEAAAPDKGKPKRLERAAKMVAMFKGMGFQGVHIGGFGLKPEDYYAVVRQAAELESRWEEFIPEVSFGRKGEFYAFPPPASYRPSAPDTDPVAGIATGRKPFMYWLMSAMHDKVFERNSRGCRLLTRYYRAIDGKKGLTGFSHFVERIMKMITFECRDCGDCALPDMAYCCPQSKCAKQQRNGPCGGSRDGMCEVYPDTKICIWTAVFERLRSDGRLNDLRTLYVPPRRAELEFTSGWANYYLERDHAGKVMPQNV